MAGVIHTIEDKAFLKEIENQTVNVAKELAEKANLKANNIVVVGCSTSEVVGQNIGSYSTPEVGETIYRALESVFSPMGVYIAAQCCEHLNRAIIVDYSAVRGAETVNVVPQPKAGGSFATAVYNSIENPVALEEIKADAGIDIGDTLIGMHLKKVAVPVKLENNKIGHARIVAARVRPKFIGGERAVYDEKLKNGYLY